MNSPLVWLNADVSKIDMNNGLISKVYDLSGNGYDATNTGNVYLEEHEGIKAFKFTSATNSYLKNTSFPALGTSSWTIAVTAATMDLNPVSNLSCIFNLGASGATTGAYVSVYVNNPRFDNAVDNYYLIGKKWNSYILTFNTQKLLKTGYYNETSNYTLQPTTCNITATNYHLNLLTGSNTYGMNPGYINEAMIFNYALSVDEVDGLFSYFNRRLSASTEGLDKNKYRNPVQGKI